MSARTTELPTPNVPLLREIANWIRRQVELGDTPGARQSNTTASTTEPVWNQSEWAYRLFGTECGTACCVAGYASLTSPDVDREFSLNEGAVVFKDSTKPMVAFPEYGQEILGLTYFQAERLFYASGSNPDHILALLDEFAGEDLAA